MFVRLKQPNCCTYMVPHKTKCLQPFKLQAFNLTISGRVGIRTPNLLIRSEMLYPIELRNQYPFGTAKVRKCLRIFNSLVKKIIIHPFLKVSAAIAPQESPIALGISLPYAF